MKKTMFLNMCSSCHWIFKLIFLVFGLLLFCEVGIYYIVLIQCYWPQLNVPTGTRPLKVMLLADTHLLGSRNGHWFDKLRREWQMHRAFQTTIALHSPDLVFFLGDVFDEGLWCDDEEFKYYVERFHSLFSVPPKTQIRVVVGNHDIGFHYRLTKKMIDRFDAAFKSRSVQLLEIRGNFFVLVNSMAMEQDGCRFCETADRNLERIAKTLNCLKTNGVNKNCTKNSKSGLKYSKPILLQHFPLYRPSDSACLEPDSAPPDIINQSFREKWDCLSQSATDKILKLVEPQLAFSGHTHHGCFVVHKSDIPEWTISSFSWRNKKEPSFMLASITPEIYSLNKCYMPRENTVFCFYSVGIILIIFWLIFTRRKLGFRSLKER